MVAAVVAAAAAPPDCMPDTAVATQTPLADGTLHRIARKCRAAAYHLRSPVNRPTVYCSGVADADTLDYPMSHRPLRPDSWSEQPVVVVAATAD